MDRSALSTLTALAGVLVLWSCGEEGPAEPQGEPRIEFSASELVLGNAREQRIMVRNTGTLAAGPVELGASPIRDRSGAVVAGSALRVEPDVVPTLNPGDEREVLLTLSLRADLAAGDYEASVAAVAGSGASLQAILDLRFTVRPPPPPGEGGDGTGIVISGPVELRQGDVTRYQVATGSGHDVDDRYLSWSVLPHDAGYFTADSRFVPYGAGQARFIAQLQDEADTLVVEIEPRGLSGSFSHVGMGEMNRHTTSDLWVHGDYAYTGTHAARTYEGTTYYGNTLHTWDISQPTNPELVSSIQVDAGIVNDVKVAESGELAVITHEGSSDGANGVTLLDLSDPSRPEPITRYTQGLSSGVHNVWIEGDYLYVALDGGGNGLRILDISDPADPREVAEFYAGESFLHDVYVRDGLAFLSHWDAGLVVLDVGNGIAGGSPTNPVEVGRVRTEGGNTHNAWYWPESGYVFVGEENFSNPGRLHVVDLRNPEEPVEVASFGFSTQTPHNFWLDESRGILYAAWYGHGVRALDVTGELLGDLGRQGREIASIEYGQGEGPDRTNSWAPQLHRGLVYVSDITLGLAVLEPQF